MTKRLQDIAWQIKHHKRVTPVTLNSESAEGKKQNSRSISQGISLRSEKALANL